jgi:hypothetical protein
MFISCAMAPITGEKVAEGRWRKEGVGREMKEGRKEVGERKVEEGWCKKEGRWRKEDGCKG